MVKRGQKTKSLNLFVSLLWISGTKALGWGCDKLLDFELLISFNNLKSRSRFSRVILAIMAAILLQFCPQQLFTDRYCQMQNSNCYFFLVVFNSTFDAEKMQREREQPKECSTMEALSLLVPEIGVQIQVRTNFFLNSNQLYMLCSTYFTRLQSL